MQGETLRYLAELMEYQYYLAVAMTDKHLQKQPMLRFRWNARHLSRSESTSPLVLTKCLQFRQA